MIVTVDVRSAAPGRTTGWERVARAIATEFGSDEEIDLIKTASHSLPRRLWDDNFRLPYSAHRYRVFHSLTYPPSPRLRANVRILTLHDTTWWRLPETASRLGRSYYRPRAEAAIHAGTVVTTVSHAMADDLLSYFPSLSGNIRVIHNGATPLPLGGPTVDYLHRPYLLYFGTAEPRKNLNRLRAAFRKTGLGEDLDLVMAGRLGWGESCGQLADYEVYIESPDDEVLGSLIRDAELVVQPSLHEGFGLPVLEALLAGKRVVCSDIPAFREIASRLPVYFDPLSVESIMDGLKRGLLSVRPPAIEIGYLADKYQWRRQADAYKELYGELSS